MEEFFKMGLKFPCRLAIAIVFLFSNLVQNHVGQPVLRLTPEALSKNTFCLFLAITKKSNP